MAEERGNLLLQIVLNAQYAAEAGVCLHAAAGDRAAVRGQRGLVASDVIAALRPLVNGL